MRQRYVLPVILAFTLTGCFAAGVKVDEHQIQQFQEGVTTYFEVVAALGKPTTYALNSDHTSQATYIYQQSQAKWQSFIPILDRLQQGSTSEQTTAVLDFDARKLLVRYTFTQGTMTVGTGVQSGAKQ